MNICKKNYIKILLKSLAKITFTAEKVINLKNSETGQHEVEK